MAEIVPLIHLQHKLDHLRSKKKDIKVIATNGCFDILHIGHIRSLQKAKNMGDILIVGLNSDESVKNLKGDSRPINNQNYRSEMLAALSSVDIVTIFNESTAEKFLEIVKPDIYVKGEEYDLDNLPEAKLVKTLGGTVIQIQNVPGYSTSEIIERIRKF
ncbi:MAG: D-glycero-beta-D-manno-heptose 1-phosphate adenylyltransferase [Candidatus Melainabacteria bacterium]|nr:D-glycero-beta-D-manno-heptose 1-phosphate adenylyltransferase [Candidatus Melainabacteria bacterium]